MGGQRFTISSYQRARQDYGVSDYSGVTHVAEESARRTGKLSEIVDPGINPIRQSKIRLDPHNGKWVSTVGCPMDIEVSCDTTGSMGSEVDKEMHVLPNLYEAVAKVLPGYDPQLCLGIFGDCEDRFVMCRPQFEMEAPKIVNYLKEMAPQRGGAGNGGEDPQYAMFARAYLTDAYTNKLGLKGYHFIITDEPYHDSISVGQLKRIFGDQIFENELKEMPEIPTVKDVVAELKKKTHQFVLVIPEGGYGNNHTTNCWKRLCGSGSVIEINSTNQLPEVISTIIGLTEGTIDITDISERVDTKIAVQLSRIDIGAQLRLRHKLKHPVPKAGDIFINKDDIWPSDKTDDDENAALADDDVNYL